MNTKTDLATAASMPRQEHRREPQPAELLRRRAALASDVMARMCHGLEDETQHQQLLAVEATLARLWPDIHARQQDDWAVEDSAALHDPDQTGALGDHGEASPTPCRYCSPPTLNRPASTDSR